MPRLSTFHGIVLAMPANDHDPPHFHVSYSGQRGRVVVTTGEVLAGSELAPRVLRLVQRWRRLHVDELLEAWAAIREGRRPGTIEPLP